MNFLITGGAGFIGSTFSKILLENKHKVCVIDDLSTGRKNNLKDLQKNKNFKFIKGDIFNKKLINKLVKKNDFVLHLAAAVGVSYIIDNPLKSILINIKGTEIILEACSKYNKKVLIASTSEVYGKQNKNINFNEKSNVIYGPPTIGRWSYAAGKLIDEFLSLAYFKEKNLKVIIVRFFNVIGPEQVSNYGMVVPRLIEQAIRNKPLTVFGSGKQTRTFSYIDDINQYLFKLIFSKKNVFGQIFNLGGDENISINDLAKKIIKISKSKSKIKKINYKKAFKNNYEDMLARKPDLEKIYNLTKYKPIYNLDDMLKKIIEVKKLQKK